MEIDPRDVLNFGDAPTESVTRLMEYSSLLVFSMETRLKGSCGDLLADYVDRGGCIVLCHVCIYLKLYLAYKDVGLGLH